MDIFNSDYTSEQVEALFDKINAAPDSIVVLDSTDTPDMSVLTPFLNAGGQVFYDNSGSYIPLSSYGYGVLEFRDIDDSESIVDVRRVRWTSDNGWVFREYTLNTSRPMFLTYGDTVNKEAAVAAVDAGSGIWLTYESMKIALMGCSFYGQDGTEIALRWRLSYIADVTEEGVVVEYSSTHGWCANLF